jgi:hypothetical protein
VVHRRHVHLWWCPQRHEISSAKKHDTICGIFNLAMLSMLFSMTLLLLLQLLHHSDLYKNAPRRSSPMLSSSHMACP